MKTKLRLSYAIFSSALIWSVLRGSSLLAGTLLVDDDKVECPGAGFNSIQAAVDAAAPGDTVQVCPGTYDEQVEIAKPLSLVGVIRAGKGAAVVQPSNVALITDFLGEPEAPMVWVHDTSDVMIRNLTIDGINNGLVCDDTVPTMDGIFYQNASGIIDSVAIKNILSPQNCAFGDGIDVLATTADAQQVTIKDSSLHDYDSGGILAIGNGVSVSAIRNVVTGRGPSLGQAGIQFDGPTGLIEENVITNHVTADFSQSTFDSGGIGVFEVTGNTRIVRNIVGNSNVGMFIGAFPNLDANGVTVVGNTVFDSRRPARYFRERKRQPRKGQHHYEQRPHRRWFSRPGWRVRARNKQHDPRQHDQRSEHRLTDQVPARTQSII